MNESSLGFTFPGLEKGFPTGAIVDSAASLPYLRDHASYLFKDLKHYSRFAKV